MLFQSPPWNGGTKLQSSEENHKCVDSYDKLRHRHLERDGYRAHNARPRSFNARGLLACGQAAHLLAIARMCAWRAATGIVRLHLLGVAELALGRDSCI